MTLQQLRYVMMIAENGSMNEAAKRMFISQPSLSGSVKELEREIGIELFMRTNRGIVITPAGEEFMGYARQVLEQYQLLEQKFIEKKTMEKFSVSAQHYSFAVSAFVEIIKKVGMKQYDYAIHETKTHEVIENVKIYKSEIGVLYINDFNEQILRKIFRDHNLEFHELFQCDTYVYLSCAHPLAEEKKLYMEQLQSFPCLAFDQGANPSFYLAEEMKSSYNYKKIIKANDRATMLNLMEGLNGYTLCSGIISDKLNGDGYKAIPLNESEKMRIGYIKRCGANLSDIAKLYITELQKYKNMVLL